MGLTDDQLRALPKAELHVHLEGTLEPEDLLGFARRNEVPVPWRSAEEVRAAYRFPGLEGFLAVYFAGCQVLRRGADFYDLTMAYLRRSAAQGVVRAEVFFGPQTFLDAGVPLGEQLAGILGAIRDARTEWGIDAALLISAHRHRTQEDALELLAAVEPWRSAVTGVGLGSAEVGNPPAKFADYYARARERGYRTTVHAGEEGPAEYVRQALEVCRVERIDHGNAAAGHPELVEQLVGRGVALTMCPLSNLRLHVVPHLADHPIRRLRDAGVAVTVNSDDPGYFGGLAGDNYVALRNASVFGDDELVELAGASFAASFADDSARRAGLAQLDRFVADVRRGA